MASSDKSPKGYVCSSDPMLESKSKYDNCVLSGRLENPSLVWS